MIFSLFTRNWPGAATHSNVEETHTGAETASLPVRGIRSDTAVFEVPEFDVVYEAHFTFVWRLVCRLGADDAVEDLVQQVFLVAHRKLAEFQGRSSIRTWLYTITRHVVKDHFRSLRRKPEMSSIEETFLAASGPGPDEHAQQRQDLALLRRILDTMDDRKREVFVLVEMEGFAIPEIAAALHVNENTLYARLRSARQHFNSAVEEYGKREETGGNHERIEP